MGNQTVTDLIGIINEKSLALRVIDISKNQITSDAIGILLSMMKN